jgi:hypothetical protein
MKGGKWRWLEGRERGRRRRRRRRRLGRLGREGRGGGERTRGRERGMKWRVAMTRIVMAASLPPPPPSLR